MKINKDVIINKIKEKGDILTPTQNKVSLPLVYRIYRKMEHGIKFMPIWVGTDNVIIDGHHRYIGALLSNYPIESVENYKKPSYVNVYSWNDVEFIEEDYDSASKIRMWNEKDARYNGMEIADIERIIE